ncbi:MAG: NusA-like transcription termination signal-binding factor [Halobacteriaceae archaeon]
MALTFTDEERRYMGLFEEETDVQPLDCVIDNEFDRVVFVVKQDQIAKAIGTNGQHVKQLQEKIGGDIEVVENAELPGQFVANALEPAAVYDVEIEDNEETIAYADVDEEDKGVAIGKDGRNIEMAKRLADRHFGIDDIQLT